jgi:hypothetical protein
MRRRSAYFGRKIQGLKNSYPARLTQTVKALFSLCTGDDVLVEAVILGVFEVGFDGLKIDVSLTLEEAMEFGKLIRMEVREGTCILNLERFTKDTKGGTG